MKPALRKFVHELAGDYGIETESVDPEPRRSVGATLGLKSAVPDVTVSYAMRMKKLGKLKYGYDVHRLFEKKEGEEDTPKRDKMKKGFAKPIPVPVAPKTKTMNPYALLN
ncbi:hypothetical protein BC829DRAFT_407408, partial [Chytridium lagenaria]